MRLKVNDIVLVKPDFTATERDGDGRAIKKRIPGKVVYINHTHGWYCAEFKRNGYTIRECFYMDKRG